MLCFFGFLHLPTTAKRKQVPDRREDDLTYSGGYGRSCHRVPILGACHVEVWSGKLAFQTISIIPTTVLVWAIDVKARIVPQIDGVPRQHYLVKYNLYERLACHSASLRTTTDVSFDGFFPHPADPRTMRCRPRKGTIIPAARVWNDGSAAFPAGACGLGLT